MQKIVLVNPMVYASDGLRAALVPQSPHLSLAAMLGGLAAFNAALIAVGRRQFHEKAVC